MFFRPASIPVPELLRVPPLARSQHTSRARYLLPLSGFQLDVGAAADEVLRLEVQDSDGAQLMELPETPEPLGSLGAAWRGGVRRRGRSRRPQRKAPGRDPAFRNVAY